MHRSVTLKTTVLNLNISFCCLYSFWIRLFLPWNIFFSNCGAVWKTRIEVFSYYIECQSFIFRDYALLVVGNSRVTIERKSEEISCMEKGVIMGLTSPTFDPIKIICLGSISMRLKKPKQINGNWNYLHEMLYYRSLKSSKLLLYACCQVQITQARKEA